MSLRSNKLEFLPDEIGQMTKLRVLNLSDNRYTHTHTHRPSYDSPVTTGCAHTLTRRQTLSQWPSFGAVAALDGLRLPWGRASVLPWLRALQAVQCVGCDGTSLFSFSPLPPSLPNFLLVPPQVKESTVYLHKAEGPGSSVAL